MKKLAMAASAVLLAAAGAACGTASATPPQKSLAHTVTVNEGEMFLHASTTRVAAGKVTFSVTNHGAVHHEFVIVSGNPAGTVGDEPGRVSEAHHIGGAEGPEIGDIAPGRTKSLTADLSPGLYTAMCNLPGHYVGGMRFLFVVR